MRIVLYLFCCLLFTLLSACGSTKKTVSNDKEPTPSLVDYTNDDDFDGVKNSEDQCPYIHGPARTFGCPDADNDGIQDDKDVCPDLKGFANMQGCIDSDHDGVIDPLDKCPDEYGESELGCNTFSASDTDGDGVNNDVDKCPDLPGLFTGNGCPDGDGDGITDDIDLCPYMYGTTEFEGCPLPFNDVMAIIGQYGDPNKKAGVSNVGYYRAFDGKLYDSNDRPINVVGGSITDQSGAVWTKENDFSVDADGVIRNSESQMVKLDDENYLFLKNKGLLNRKPINVSASNNSGIQFGNEERSSSSSGSVNFNNNSSWNQNNAFKNNDNATSGLSDEESANCNRIDLNSLKASIYFDYDATVAGGTSLRYLNRVVDAMKKCSSFELQIAGHADGDGSTSYNKVLSQKRAVSLLNYISGKGVSDKRLKYNAYGEKYPIAPNTTEEGKQKNRRAEISITRSK